VAERQGPSRKAPRSTYRLQITADFDLFEAAGRLPYLHDLGVDWVYLSPILQAQPGSTHGYDVVRHDAVDESRGGSEGLATLSAEARRLGMGVLVDIVPNHIGVEPFETGPGGPPQGPVVANPGWQSLLHEGQDSPYAHFFDVDWDYGDGRLVLPSAENGGDLNYRRFFTISTLAGVRVEEREVFDATHVEIRRWFVEGLVDGLRIDHPDGLRDPIGYLRDLSELTDGAYVLVEKILETGERLEDEWSCDGTTGYDALALIDRVLVDPDGVSALPQPSSDFAELVHDRKLDVATGTLLPETKRIVRDVVSTSSTTGGDEALEAAVSELLACFPVYRSYLPHGEVFLRVAFTEAAKRRPDLVSAFSVLTPILNDPTHLAALRFQQTSGMVMAKGVEDNSFYRWFVLTSLNEVGGDPSALHVTPGQFHGFAALRQHEWPNAMTALTTHDTKRSEDTRARITALAEVPGEWSSTLEELQRLAPMPEAGLANLLWQAVVGAWPISRERIHAYAEKAMREAGEHTDWMSPDEEFEASVHGSLDAAYDDPAVTDVVEKIVARVEATGRSNALAAKLVAITMPGVPDVYQGTELGDFSLVDPDNRRPVDFDAAARSLASGENDKQALTAEALRLRRDRPELFTSYDAVPAEGPAADHVLAFDRGGAITVVTRLPIGLEAKGGWGDTVLRLPEGDWVDALSGFDKLNHRVVALADLLTDLPVALLVRNS
jgi:(1->4)-alpha-D-glucan 1-alpha-D-glucosylmutase